MFCGSISICRDRVPGVALAALALLTSSCLLHDTSLSLRNDKPRIVDVSPDVDTVDIHFPDSTAFTLTVADLNDSLLRVDTGSWPGSYVQEAVTLEEKRLIFYHGGRRLGKVFEDVLRIRDDQGAACSHAYRVRKLFVDPLDAIPQEWWHVVCADTSLGTVQVSTRIPSMKSVEFFFDTASVRDSVQVSLISTFGLRGDFSWSLNYWLRNDLVDDFELQFSCTTEPDTSVYTGERILLALAGRENSFTYRYRDAATSWEQAAEREMYYGPVRFMRRGEDLTIWHRPYGQPYRNLTDFNPLNYATDETVYIHVRMDVTDFGREKFCDFFEFTITEGEIVL